MKKTFITCAAVILAASYTCAFSADDKHATANARITEQAWRYFKAGDYKKARNIVDRYYAKDNVPLSFLSGMLYAREGQCEQALGAIEYASAYIDQRGFGAENDTPKNHGVSRFKAMKESYLGMKLLGVKCHMQLEQWYGAAHDAKMYLKFDPDNQAVLLALGDSSTELARQSKDTAIASFERAWEMMHSPAGDSKKKNSPNGGFATTISNDGDVFWLRLVELYEWDGHHEKAVDFTVKLLSESPYASRIVEAMKKRPELVIVLNSPRVKEKVKELDLR